MAEPPQKITKFEMDSQYLEGEVMDEGQEEWLSEGVLTDDDYNPASQQTEADPNDSYITSQDEAVHTSHDESMNATQDETMNASHDETMNSGQDDTMNSAPVENSECHVENVNIDSSNIEETLNNLENSKYNNQSSELPEELNAFLIRKSDGMVVGSDPPNKGSDIDESVKQSDDDGNDTDDLLRVLGDGDKSSEHIKKEKIQIKVKEHSSDEDDTYIFEGKKQNNVKMAKMVLSRAPVAKAEPEDDVTDCSADEEETIRALTLKQDNSKGSMQISTNVKPGNFTITPLKVKEEPKEVTRKVVNIGSISTTAKKEQFPVHVMSKPVQPARSKHLPRRQYVNKRVQGASPIARAAGVDIARTQPSHERDISEDRQNMNLDEEYSHKSKESKPTLKLMQPEEMDEEVPSDAASDSDEESLLSELPSSDSDMDDWFTLDIRAERAGDYIPLLGNKAYQILSEEKRRVAARLNTLKKSLATLSQNGQELAEKLREATNTHAELDAMLKIV